MYLMPYAAIKAYAKPGALIFLNNSTVSKEATHPVTIRYTYIEGGKFYSSQSSQ
jgi:hypothetical protein